MKMLRLHPDYEHRNRAYVIDNAGNKLFYGTVYACQRFIVHIEKGEENDGTERSRRKAR